MPFQPIAATVRTSCSGSSRMSARGKDSSRRIRTSSQQVSGEFEGSYRLFTAHRGEIVEELIQAVPGGKVVEEVLHGHSGSAEDWRTAQDLRVTVHDSIQRRHVAYRTPESLRIWPQPPRADDLSKR